MDWRTRVGELERWGSYRSAVELLEKLAPQLDSAEERADALFARATMLDDVFLQKKDALALYDEVRGLSPDRIDALRRARFIHRSFGDLEAVRSSLEYELSSSQDAVLMADLFRELAEVLQDLGNDDDARAALERALVLHPAHLDVRGMLDDLEALRTPKARQRLDSVVAIASDKSGAQACRLLLRAARMARRRGDGRYVALLTSALRSSPMDVEAGSLLESAFFDQRAGGEGLAKLRDVHREVLERIDDRTLRARVAIELASRWLNRFDDADAAAELLQLARSADPAAPAPYVFLLQYYKRQNEIETSLALVDEGVSKIDGKSLGLELWLLAEGAKLAKSDLRHTEHERRYLNAFNARAPTASQLPDGVRPGDECTSTSEWASNPHTTPVTITADSGEAAVRTHERPDSREFESQGNGMIDAESKNQSNETRTLSAEAVAKLAELDEALSRFESQKRWSDAIRTILAKAELVATPDERIVLLSQAGSMYLEKSSNQAEAIKCYEAVLSVDPHNAEALEKLRDMYERRRDWERLIRVMQVETSLLPAGDRPARYAEMAKLATERLRKPEVSIELWQAVLENDPENHEALSNLSNLYNSARKWDQLAAVLETMSERTLDRAELSALLQKLGIIYADKLNDDAGAVRAFQRILELDPQDRRAQEQLKRRYVSLKAWDDLEQFYAATERWDELIRTLEREAESQEAPVADKLELLFRVARLWETKKDKKDRAARAYEKVLELDPANLDAAVALSPIYEAANDARKLAAVYEVRLRHVDDVEERVTLLRRTGALYEERLRDPANAFDKYLDAFAADPTREETQEDVERLAGQIDGWERAITAYTHALEGTTARADATNLRVHLGRVLTRVGRIDDAIEQYRTVYEEDGEHTEAIESLERLYRETSRFSELLGVYERRMELEHDPEGRLRLAYERAGLWEHQLRQLEKAITAYVQILEEYGDGEVQAYEALDRLYAEREEWSELARILERRIDLGTDNNEELATLKFRLAQVSEYHLDDKERAIDLYREVLLLAPEHEDARVALEALLNDPALGGIAARILEPIYEIRGEWSRLITALEVLLRGTTASPERLEMLTRIAEVYSVRLQDPRKSFEAYGRALQEAPDSKSTLAHLEGLAIEQGRFADLVTLVSELATSTQDKALARTLWIKAAQIQDTQLEDVESSVASYMHVLDADSDDEEVLGALESLYQRTERWKDLLGILKRRADLTSDPGDKEHILGQVARIHMEMLQQPEDAIRVYREILELDPASPGALAALDDLLEQQQMWSDLADNVGRRLAVSSDPHQQTALMLRLASLREERMNAVDAAIEMYREVLLRDAQNLVALRALERLVQKPEHQVEIAEILEPIYRDANEFDKLIQIHEIQARHASAVERRIELLHQIAELYEIALDDPERAFAMYSRALAEDPGNGTTQEQLERLSRASGAWESLAKVYEHHVQAIDDPQLAAALHMKAAEIYEHQLGNTEGAIDHYRRVLALDPTQLNAATALERLFQLTERYEELAKIYLAKANMLSAPDEAKEYLFRAAFIYEDVLERPLAAVEVYSRILESDPEELRALDKLIEQHLRLENWDQLLEVYTRKADIVVDLDEKKRLFVEVGAVYERERGDVAKAIDTYQRILEIDPDDMMAISRLDSLYQASGNWQELLSVLEREADLASDPGEVISYRYRIAELWEQKLGDPARAVEGYREILSLFPDHAPTLQALEAMVSQGREPLAAAAVLDPVYRRAGEWAKLIGIHQVEVHHESDPARKVELLHEVAELYEFQLDQGRPAFEAFAQALPIELGNERTLLSLERLAETLGAWGEVTRLYDEQIRQIQQTGADGLVDMALRVAQIYEVQVGDVESAIARYRIVLEADPIHVQAIEALDRLYEATERWGDLAQILHSEIQVAGSPDEVLQLQFRLGQIYQSRLGNVDQAIEQYRDILAAAPEHSQALGALEMLFAEGVRPLLIGEILEPLYRMQQAWARLVSVYEVQLEYQEETVERVSMMHRMAEIAEERADDHALAFEWMQRALLEDPLNEDTNTEVVRLAGMVDGWTDLANTYADVVQNAEDPAVQSVIARRLAQVYETELGDTERAEETYRYVLSVDGRNSDALEALDRIYEENGAHEALTDILRKRIAASDSTQDLVELHYRLGQVLERDLGRQDEAIAVYVKVAGDLDTHHLDSIRALQRIYATRGEWELLLGTLEKELDVVLGDTAQSEILAKMARLAADELADASRATALWRRVLDLRGEDPEALNALGDLYAEQENWRDLVDILEREVSIATDDGVRMRIYADLGRVWYENLQRERNALESWERVLDIDPTNTEALFALAVIYRASQSWNELADTLNRIIEVGAATLDDADLESVYMQLGELYASHMQQPMEAIDSYRKAVEINPRNFDSLDALEKIHQDEGQWEECIDVMEKRVEALEVAEEKIGVLLAIAHMWDDKVGSKDQGTSAYERILALEPLHELAFERLESLHKDAMRWESLIEMYLQRAEATEEVRDRVRLIRKIAHVYEHELGDRERAFEALQLAWSEDYTDAETASELERLAAATQKWNDLLTSANEALAHIEDPQLKIAICLSCSRWYGTELGHPEYAIPYYQQILALDPANVPAMRQMADLYRATQQWQTLGQVLGRLVEMTSDPAAKAGVYVEMGELCEEQLGYPDQAPVYYNQALEVDPHHLGALEALERIYKAKGQWRELLDMLERKVEVYESPADILDTKLQIAETYEYRLEEPESAIRAYNEVLQAEPNNLDALKGLERLYAQRERFQDLLTVLEAQFEIVSTEKERIQILTRVAGMWEEEFVKPDKAAERLEQVIDIDPQHSGALRGLARLYRNMQRWDDLISTFERNVAATPDRQEKIQLYKQIGEVVSTELQDADRAIDAYLNVLNLDDSDAEALSALTDLYEKRGDFSAALDASERLVGVVSDPQEVVELRFRMGRILDEHLGDRASAIESFQNAIDVDASHLPSLEALRRIYIDTGDWLSAARTLEQEAEYQQNPRQVAKVLVELGRIYDERLEEHPRAVECFEGALARDPDNEDAALPLVDEYFGAARWADAFPLLQALVRRGTKREPEEQHRLNFMLGETASHLGDDEQATKAFTRAYQINATHLPSLMGLAGAYYRTRDWEKAFKFYQMLLVHHRDSLGKDEITDIFYRLGVIKREQGERRKALNMFDKALEEDAHHRPTLEAVIGLYQSQNEWEQVIHFKKQILQGIDDSEKHILLEEIGDLWNEKLKNQQKAIQSYVEASEIRPEDHRILHKLLALFQETRQWEKAIEIIHRISDLDERPAAKSKYLYTIGVILRDELKNADEAVVKFNDALDIDSTQLKAFEAINKILTQKKDWKQLERAFRKMLHRIAGKGNDELEFNLWHNLGVIYRDRLKQFESAAESFAMASRVRPDSPTEHQILAELYTVIPNRIEDAINEHQWLLRQDPYRVESYQALYKLYFDARAYDKAWCLASTLAFLKQADAEQQQFYEQYRVRGMIRPQTRLDDQRWVKDLFHPDEDLFVGKIFEKVTPAVLALKQVPDKQYGLNKKYQVDPMTSTAAFAKAFSFVAQVLNLPTPRLFLRPDVQGGLAYAVTNPPASVCGSSLLMGVNPQDLTFVIAKHLSYYRGEHYLRQVLPTAAESKLVLLAAMRLAGLGPADPNVDQTAQQLSAHMQPVHLEALVAVCKRFMEAGARTDIKKFMRSVELTGCRTGFLICNDLEIAARMVQAEPPSGPSDVPAKEKVTEMVLFGVSEEYFRLREALGIQINIG